MAVDTLRANKMRSALTILGVVIGITSIVSMTALIRGFDESFKDLFRQVGPSTMFIQKFGFVSFSQGKQFRDLIKRPNLTIADAEAIEALAADPDGGDPGGRRPGVAPGALHLRQQRHQADGGDRRHRELRRRPTRSRSRAAASSPSPRSIAAAWSSSSATRPAKALFPNTDPIGKKVRAGKGRIHGGRRLRQAARTRSAAARPTSSRSSLDRAGRRSTARTASASSASSIAT